MEINDLGMLERAFIVLRCRRDLRKRRFEKFEYTNIEGMSKTIFLSPFVTTELAYFITKRIKKLGKSIVLLNTSETKSLFGIRFFSVPNAICKIDELVAEMERQISSSQKDCADKIATLQDMSDCFSKHNATHHAQVCIDKIATLRTEEQNDIHKLQKKLLSFANEKVKVICAVNAKIDAFKAHQIMRIQYYYGYASTHSQNIPVMMYTQEDFEAITGEEIRTEHTGILDNAQQKVKEIAKATTERCGDEDASD